MRDNKAMPWIGGAVVLGLLIAAGGWFLGINPALTAASEARAQTATERDRNELLRVQNETLKEQFAHLADYEAQLAALQVQIPATTDLSALNLHLTSLVTTAGLTTTSLAVTTPQAFVPVAEPAAAAPDAAAPPTTDGAGEAAPAAEDAAAPAPVAPTYAGFYAIPVTLTTVGTYEATLAFLESLQADSSRLFLVGSIAATTQVDQGAGSGKPATSAGDLETVVTGFTYVLQDPSAAPPVTDPAAEPVPLPVPADQRNPFVPVA